LEKRSDSQILKPSITRFPNKNMGQRICIYIGESDRWRGKPLDTAILETLRSQGLAGATVFRGISGFGAHSHIRTSSIEVLSVDLPVLIEVVDTPERIKKALEFVSPMIGEGLITLEDVTIVKYTHRYMNPLPADRLVSEVMTEDVVSLSETMPVKQAWEKMIHNELKAMPVIDNNNVVTGILTDEDMLERAGIRQRLSVTLQMENSMIQEELQSLGKSDKLVKDVMTKPVITINKEDTLGHAVAKMVQAGLKRLPVVDNSARLVGVLSRLDILKQVADSPSKSLSNKLPVGAVRVVRDIMRDDIPTINTHENLSSIVEKFVISGSHRLVVVNDEGKAVGLIADSDVVSRVLPEHRRGILDAFQRIGKPPAGKETAADIMSSGVIMIQPETSIAEASRLMLAEGRKWLVVVNNEEKPIGLVDRRVLLENLGINF